MYILTKQNLNKITKQKKEEGKQWVWKNIVGVTQILQIYMQCRSRRNKKEKHSKPEKVQHSHCMPRFLSVSQDGMLRRVAPTISTLKKQQKYLTHQLQETSVCDGHSTTTIEKIHIKLYWQLKLLGTHDRNRERESCFID